ncbi:MAG: hypothetical protein ACLFTW_10725 [Chitinispirillaceae bacterium]
MNRLVRIASLIFLVAVPLIAGIPVQSMNESTLGVEYSGLTSGQLLDEDKGESSIISHFFRLQYSPVSLLRFSLGVGSSRLGIESGEVDFCGEPGLAAMGGAALNLPRVHRLVSLTGGVESYYLSSVSGDLRSIAFMHTPFAGLIVHLSPYVDMELGGSYHILDKQIKTDDRILNFRNSEQMRFYGSLTLHDPLSGVYISGGVSSPGDFSDVVRDGSPYRSSAWIQFGIILKQDKEFARTEREIRKYFSSHKQLKERDRRL